RKRAGAIFGRPIGMSQRHCSSAVGIHDDPVDAQGHVRCDFMWITLLEHLVLHPGWRKAGAARIAAGIPTMARRASFIEYAGMCVEYATEGVAWLQNAFDGTGRLAAGLVEFEMTGAWFADQDSPHHGGMVMGTDTGPFERELVACVEEPSARLVAA